MCQTQIRKWKIWILGSVDLPCGLNEGTFSPKTEGDQHHKEEVSNKNKGSKKKKNSKKEKY